MPGSVRDTALAAYARAAAPRSSIARLCILRGALQVLSSTARPGADPLYNDRPMLPWRARTLETTSLILVALSLASAGCGSTPTAPSPSPAAPAVVTPPVSLACAIGTTDCSAVMAGQTVAFTAQRGANLNVRATALDFGDGTVAELGALPGPARIEHAYDRPGAFTARLTVTDSAGATFSASAPVSVGSLVSVAMSATAVGSLMVTATAQVSGATAARYEWVFDPLAIRIVTTEPRASFTYSTIGWKDLQLLVTLSDGRTVRASASVVVE